MNDNQSYSLLSQEEIDVLVMFLTNNKNTVNSEVLSQTSIDKLIRLITSDQGHIQADTSDPFSSVKEVILIENNFRTKDQICSIDFSVDGDTGYVVLTATNDTTGETLAITPALLDGSDVTDWGCSITPNMFNQIARTLKLKYTPEVHQAICNHYAKVTYGEEAHVLSSFVLPTNSNLLEVMK